MGLTRITSDGITDGAITGSDLATNVDLVDNQKLRIGTGNDLLIWHGVDGSENSYITQQTGKHLIIKADSALQIRADSLNLWNHAQSERYIACTNNSSVELYYDNSKKFETASNGLIVTGSSTVIQQQLNTSDGTARGYIYADNTNSLYLLDGQAHKILKGIKDGAVELYYDNSKKFETRSNGANLIGNLESNSFTATNGDAFIGGDNKKLVLGTGSDLQIYHDGTNSVLSNATGTLYYLAGTQQIMNLGGTETMAKFIENGAVELYHNNIKKLSTTSDGIRIDAAEGGEAIINFHADESDDAADRYRIVAQDSGDLVFQRHNGSAFSSELRLKSAGGIQANFQGSNKFETTSGGIEVSGGANFTSGNVSLVDNSKIKLGTGDDLQIYHDGSHSYVSDTSTGNLKITSNGTAVQIEKSDGENMAVFRTDGAVELYHDNSKKLETTSVGAKISGDGEALKIQGVDGDTFMKILGNTNINVILGHLNDQGFVGNSTNHDFFIRTNNQNRISISNSGTLSGDLNDTSDENLKENIVSISDDAISDIKKLRPVNFDWKDSEKAKNQSGFIAQEVKTILPNLVVGEEYDESKENFGFAINTSGVVAHLTKALQEAIIKIETLETEVAALKGS